MVREPVLPNARRPTVRGAARRQALLDAAVQLFSERGFRGTGIIGLGRAVGLTHAGLLHHFGTKEQLLREVVAQRDHQQQGVIAAMAGRRGLDALRTLQLAGEDIVANRTLARLFAVLVAENFQADDPLHGYFQDRHLLMRVYFAQAVETGIEDGEIRPGANAELLGTEITAFLVGLQTEWLLDPDRIDIPASCRRYLDRLLADLAVRPEAHA
jgi:AcrR family transcriptional regulator